MDDILQVAREIAENACRSHGVVSADDVQARLAELGYSSADLGNAAGSVFRGGTFESAGFRRSTREGNNARTIRIWKLAAPPPKFDTSPPMKLLHYQTEPARVLAEGLRRGGFHADLSEMGTGKTYVACAAVREAFGPMAPVTVVCPKAVVHSWEDVAEGFGLDARVTNYERLVRGSEDELVRWEAGKPTWVRPSAPVIFDEAQRCKGQGTKSSRLLTNAVSQNMTGLLLSGTLATTPLEMQASGFALGLHHFHDFHRWAAAHGCRMGFYGFEFTGGARDMLRIFEAIKKRGGVRLLKKDIPGFPDKTVDTLRLNLGRRLFELHEEMLSEILDLARAMEEDADHAEHPMVAVLRARQETELLKVPLLAEQMLWDLDAGHCPVAFMNFSASVDALQLRLSDAGHICGIYDGRTKLSRNEAVELFQAGHMDAMVVNTQSGGVGLSLHDLCGRPRRSYIMPTWSAADLAQAIDRIHRAGSLSPAHATVVFADHGPEKAVCGRVQKKLDNLAALNDGDLQHPYEILVTNRQKKAEEGMVPASGGLATPFRI